MKDKEISVFRKQTEAAIGDYETFKITSAEKLNQAIITRKNLLILKKQIIAKEKTAADPIKKSLEVIRGWFFPLKEAVRKADAHYYAEMMVWEQQKRREEMRKVEELENKVKVGKITLATAGKRIEKIEEKRQAIPTRRVSTVRILNFAKLPDDYKLPDLVKIKIDILAGLKVVGAELYQETIIVNKG